MTQQEALPIFWSLPADERKDAYAIAGQDQNRSQLALEKDLWVVWTLDALFTCPGLPKMAFKGGTSLSKVYDAIARFSEDIDITMDCRELDPDLNPFEETTGSKQRRRDDDTLKAQVLTHSNDLVVPHLTAQAARMDLAGLTVEVEAGGEVVWVRYPTDFPGDAQYLREGVKIEFGGRNMTEPHKTVEIRPYLVDTFKEQITFPSATVDALAAERTFWEKFTLAHAECNRPAFRTTSERLSRHWYDLAVLAQHDIGRNAIADRALLENVVKVKTRFYNSATANYDHCLTGKANLIPDTEGLAVLAADYKQMLTSGMLEKPVPFDDVIATVRQLQDTVNTTFG